MAISGGPRSAQSRVPVGMQIHNDFAAMIEQNKLAPGVKLPTVREVAKQYGVSPKTAALAFERLRGAGLVSSRAGSGTFVSSPPDVATATELIFCASPYMLHEGRETWRVFARLRGVTLAAQQHNARLFIITDGAELERYVHPNARQGIILFSSYEDAIFGSVVKYAADHEWPICLVMGSSSVVPFLEDHRDVGFELATAHLLALGHRRVAYLGTPIDPTEVNVKNRPAWRGRLGYWRALKHAGIPADPGYCEEASIPELDGPLETVQAVERLLSRSPRPTAIVCNNDDRALVVLDVLRTHGVRVPEDISVVGYDDSPEAQKSTPALTSVDTQLSAQGEEAVGYVVNRLLGRKAPLPSVMPRLVVRASSDVPKKA